MSNVTGIIRGRLTVQEASTPKVYNVTVALANTEVSQMLSIGTKAFTIKVRGVAALKLAFVSGESSTNYFSVSAGTSYSMEGLNFSGILYFQTNKASQVVEILEWV